MTVNFNYNKLNTPERIFTSKSVGELFWIIGDKEFLEKILKDETEQAIIYKRWKENKTLDAIAKEIGISYQNAEYLYAQIVRKVKAKTKKFIKFYLNTQVQDIKTNSSIKGLSNLLVNDKKEIEDECIKLIPISNLIKKQPRWIDALKSKGILTLGQIQNYTRKEVSLFESIGPLAIQEIDFLLNYYNLNYKSSL